MLKYIFTQLKNNIRYTVRGIKNLIKWFPIIWYDRDWDHYFIFEILKQKLKFQSNHIRRNNNHTRSSYDADRMDLCVTLIDRIQEEHYAMEHMDYCESEYNFFAIPNSEYKRLDIKEISENYDDFFNMYKSATRKVLTDKRLQIFELNEDNYKQRLAMNVSYYNEMRCQRLLFQLLDKHIRGWWD